MPSSVNTPSGQLDLSFEPGRQIFKVGELNAAVQRLLEGDFRNILVAGEISGCRVASSGHYYFALKDEQSQLKCVLFKGSARFTRAKPRDGVAVIARGSLEVYEARGEYQLIVETLEPQGAGALQLAFEELKKKLGEEGLFDSALKKALPKLPRRIAVVTSPSGAAIQDILQVLGRRFRGLHIRLYPAQVQGEGAAEQVCAALRHFNGSSWPDVLILARGGGSLEDLWTFNEESVARAIASCRVPVISAIGHETDFTIADFVADHRAPTPSAAAEIVIRTSDSVFEQIAACRNKIIQALRYRLAIASRDLHRRVVDQASRSIHRRLAGASQRTDELDERLRHSYRKSLERGRKRLTDLSSRLQAADLRLRFAQSRHAGDLLTQRLMKATESKLWRARARHESLQLHLTQLSPLTVLARGYAIVRKADGGVLMSSQETTAGEELRVRLSRGELQVTVSGATDNGPYTEA